jgi:hypothetical protein
MKTFREQPIERVAAPIHLMDCRVMPLTRRPGNDEGES